VRVKDADKNIGLLAIISQQEETFWETSKFSWKIFYDQTLKQYFLKQTSNLLKVREKPPKISLI